MIRGAVGGLLAAVLALQTMGCTDDDARDASPASSSEPSTAPLGDPLLAACDHFRTTWVEFAQIDSELHGFGDTTPDPHGVRAGEAAEAAFAAAKRGPAEVQRLGALAESQFEGRSPGDFWNTVTQFFDLCGQEVPSVQCEEQTACESAGLDRGIERT